MLRFRSETQNRILSSVVDPYNLIQYTCTNTNTNTVLHKQRRQPTPHQGLLSFSNNTLTRTCTQTHTPQTIDKHLLFSVNPALQARRKFYNVSLFIPVTLYPRRYTGVTHHNLMTHTVGWTAVLRPLTYIITKWVWRWWLICAGDCTC